MISAVKTGKKNKNIIREIDALKNEFGIENHYLEGLI